MLWLCLLVWSVVAFPLSYEQTQCAVPGTVDGDGGVTSGGLRCVDISNDGTLVVVGTGEPKVKVYEMWTWILIHQQVIIGTPTSVRFAPDMSFIVVVTDSSNFYTLSGTNYATIDHYTSGSDAYIFDADIDSTSSHFMTCGSGQRIIIYQFGNAGSPSDYLLTQQIYSCEFADDDWIGVGLANGSVELYDSDVVHQSTYDTAPTGGTSFSVSFFPSTHEFILGKSDGNGYVSDSTLALEFMNNNVRATACSSTYMAYGNDNGIIRVYETGTKNFVGALGGPSDEVYGMDMSDDGRILVAASLDSYLHVYTLLNQTTTEQTSTNSTHCILYSQQNIDQCQQCDLSYYLTNNACQPCETQLQNCALCSNNSSCTICVLGYYLSSEQVCQLCSSEMQGCRICTNASVCEECMSSYYLSSVTLHCQLCTQLEYCLECRSGRQCVECQIGYYVGLLGDCERCVAPCLGCRSESSCTSCELGYYLDGSSCASCGVGCMLCANASECKGCESGYELVGVVCELVLTTMYSTTNNQITLSFTTSYINASILQHSLVVSGSTFSIVEVDSEQDVRVYLLQLDTQTRLTVTQLTIQDRVLHILTNNPVSINSDDIDVMDISGRLLAGRSWSMLDDYSVRMELKNQFMASILPDFVQDGDLALGYELSDAEFVRSLLPSLNQYQFHVFGIIVVVILLVNFTVRTCFTTKQDRKSMEIIPHVLAIKCAVLTIYPPYLQYYDFCSGFMVLDLPWANQSIGQALGSSSDAQPRPFALFYVSMNLASTYLLPICVILLVGLLNWFVWRSLKQMDRMTNGFELLYWLFIFGCEFAGMLSVQGSIFNPLSNFNVSAFFYLLGISLYILCLIQCAYFLHKNLTQNISKLRVLTKATLLSLAHNNPIYIVFMCIVLDAFMMAVQFGRTSKPKLWLLNNILCDLSLLMLVFGNNVMLSLILTMLLLIVVVVVEVYVHVELIRNQAEETSSTSSQKNKPAKLELNDTDAYNLEPQDPKHTIQPQQFFQDQQKTLPIQSKTSLIRKLKLKKERKFEGLEVTDNMKQEEISNMNDEEVKGQVKIFTTDQDGIVFENIDQC